MTQNEEINSYFDANIDIKYREFHKKLVPNVDEFRGVRLPIIKKLAKEIAKADYHSYLENVCYDSYEERMLCGLVLGNIKADFTTLKPYICCFIPHIDNWAVCDCFCASLKMTLKYKNEMLPFILNYIDSKKEYEVRFAVVMLMNYYADSEYIDQILKLYDGIKREEYYVKMAVAWAISVCFVKQRNKTLSYLKNDNIDSWTHNKAISKITESFRVTDADKILVRSLKR